MVVSGCSVTGTVVGLGEEFIASHVVGLPATDSEVDWGYLEFGVGVRMIQYLQVTNGRGDDEDIWSHCSRIVKLFAYCSFDIGGEEARCRFKYKM